MALLLPKTEFCKFMTKLVSGAEKSFGGKSMVNGLILLTKVDDDMLIVLKVNCLTALPIITPPIVLLNILTFDNSTVTVKLDSIGVFEGKSKNSA